MLKIYYYLKSYFHNLLEFCTVFISVSDSVLYCVVCCREFIRFIMVITIFVLVDRL